MHDFRELAKHPKHRRGFERLLLLAAKRGDADLVAERLGWGIDPNCTFANGRTPLIANVRGACPSAAVVRALLRFGADSELADEAALTALDYARRKLMRLMRREQQGGGASTRGCQPGKADVRSLDENGQLALGAEEQAEVDRMRDEVGAEFARAYWQERLRAARRVFDDPGEVEAIVEILEAGER